MRAPTPRLRADPRVTDLGTSPGKADRGVGHHHHKERNEDTMTEDLRPKYDVEVQLTGEDGNAFYILGKITRALQQAGATREEQDEFYAEATSGDYDHLLRTAMRWVNVR